MQEIKLWKIDKLNNVLLIKKDRLNYENKLEKWLIDDISILSNNLAVIGSQIITPHGKKIDILAINRSGELIIIELKRDKTYREVIAQVLDYATWIKGLKYDKLNEILNKYGNSEFTDIEEFFSSKFSIDSEEVELNSDHKMLIVGSEIDDSTIRIIKYLSEKPYSVNINAVSFNYFKDEFGSEFLAQSFVMPEESLDEESVSKKRNREKSIITQLFEQDKLKIGQSVYYQPAIDKGISRTNPKIKAIIVNKGMNCLQREGEIEIFSFSKLRRLIVEEQGLTEIRKFWGFGIRYEWVTEDGKKLIELFEE